MFCRHEHSRLRHDTAAGAKHERAKALVEEPWRQRTGVVSTQALQELTVNLRRKARKPLDPAATREVIVDYLAWQVVVNSGESILQRSTWSSGTAFRSGMG